MQRELRNGELAPSTGTITPQSLLEHKKGCREFLSTALFRLQHWLSTQHVIHSNNTVSQQLLLILLFFNESFGLTHGFTHQPPAGFEPVGGLRVYLIKYGLGAKFHSRS